MDQQHERSLSADQQPSHINRSHSPSGQYHRSSNPIGLGLSADTTINDDKAQQYLNPGYSPANALQGYTDGNDLLSNHGGSFRQSGQTEPVYLQVKQEEQSLPFNPPQQQQTSFTQELLSAGFPSSFNEGDFSLFSSSRGQDDQFEASYFLNELPPESGNTSINPAELNMASPHTHSNMASPHNQSTPSGTLQLDSRSSGSAHQSPSFNQAQFQSTPAHSRQVSLTPESAGFTQGQGHVEWSMMPPQFTTHRRTPSEYSDVSVSSAAHSPNIGQQDTFDAIDQHHSPMQSAQDSSLYQEVLRIGSFSISDPQVQIGASPGRDLSPAHSPSISPRISPQQAPGLNPHSSFMLGLGNDFGQSQTVYGAQSQDAFGSVQRSDGSLDMGQAQQMVPPEINVEFAPASRQNSFEPPKPSFDQDALTPPDRGRRRRAVSDPFNSGSIISRPHTPSGVLPSARSSLSTRSAEPARSLSPNDRSSATSPNRRRQSTSSLPNRDYILGLADPDYQAASSDKGSSKRLQKHPATFQCTLCPKRFTRAYNLRSHLRTHTDERPFVCTVCGKAFARQHDRKRHEGLHSGEKKFVCKGELKQGGQWGCSRRFARADALGRHFRSEAGRICIKPLLDEEAIERQRQWQEQRMQNMHSIQQPQSMSIDSNGFPVDSNGNYALPAALLQQYPALATLSWPDLAQGDVGLEDDPSGRSSFDASGSEYYDEGDDGGYLSSGPGSQQGFGQGHLSDSYNGYSSDLGGH